MGSLGIVSFERIVELGIMRVNHLDGFLPFSGTPDGMIYLVPALMQGIGQYRKVERKSQLVKIY